MRFLFTLCLMSLATASVHAFEIKADIAAQLVVNKPNHKVSTTLWTAENVIFDLSNGCELQYGFFRLPCKTQNTSSSSISPARTQITVPDHVFRLLAKVAKKTPEYNRKNNDQFYSFIRDYEQRQEPISFYIYEESNYDVDYDCKYGQGRSSVTILLK